MRAVTTREDDIARTTYHHKKRHFKSLTQPYTISAEQSVFFSQRFDETKLEHQSQHENMSLSVELSRCHGLHCNIISTIIILQDAAMISRQQPLRTDIYPMSARKLPAKAGHSVTLAFLKIASRTSCQPTPRMTGLRTREKQIE